MKKILLILLFLPILTFQQQQIGQIIFDNNAQQESEAIATNNDGSIVVVGYVGEAKVFQFLNNSWSQIGNSITAINGDFFAAVSINGQGNIIAVGAPFNDGLSAGGDDVGYTQVFINNNGVWTQLGSTIYSENNSNQHYCGEAIDLDDDGYRLAVSSSGNNQVRIFDYDGIDWNSTILPISVQAGGLLGNRIDLTPDGNTIAICGKENPNRYAQVYSFDGTNWTQKGSDIAPIQPAVGIFAFGGIIYNMDAQNLYIVNIHHQVFTSRYLSNCSAIVNALTTEGYTDWQIPSETDLDNICPSKSFIDLAASNYPNTASSRADINSKCIFRGSGFEFLLYKT